MTACVLCGRAVVPRPGVRLRPERARCEGCARVHVQTSSAPVVHPSLPYERDPAAQVFVELYPDGSTYAHVGAVMGVTREAARVIGRRAVAKLAAALGESSDLNLEARTQVRKGRRT